MSGISIAWNGGEVEFGVTRVPIRKKPALYRKIGTQLEVLAYFRDERCAKEFERLLDTIAEQSEAVK